MHTLTHIQMDRQAENIMPPAHPWDRQRHKNSEIEIRKTDYKA